MGSAQQGIFIEESTNFYFLEYELNPNCPASEVRRAIQSSVRTQDDEGPHIVVSFGKKACSQLGSSMKPQGFQPFEPISGTKGHTIPSTQRDIFFWIHGSHHDANFAEALRIQSSMNPVAELKLDLAGFQYLDSRDLIGFIDGTANPKREKVRSAALIPEGQPGSSGSFVLSQQWVHNLAAFNKLSQTEQEQVMGRTKPDSVELEGAAMPPTSHVSRTDFKENGKALKIYRRSAPYGTVK